MYLSLYNKATQKPLLDHLRNFCYNNSNIVMDNQHDGVGRVNTCSSKSLISFIITPVSSTHFTSSSQFWKMKMQESVIHST